MSLGVAIKVPEGIVLAAESRVTLQAKESLEGGKERLTTVHFDYAKKVLQFSRENVGAVTWGLGVIGERPIHSFIPEFEVTVPPKVATTREFAEHLSRFLWQNLRTNHA